MKDLGKWWIVGRREWQVAFQTPLAYVLLGLWMLIAGFFYIGQILSPYGGSTDMGTLVGQLVVLVLFLAPFLTMRLLAEERRMRSDELILTAPLSPAQWVVGKFVGAMLIWTVFTLAAGLFPLVTSRLGLMDWGTVGASWLGLWLFGATGLAVGLFASAITENQLVAAMVSFVILLLLYLATIVTSGGWLATFMTYMSLPTHLTSFTIGQLAVKDLVYYLSLIAGFLFLSVRAVDLRRWA